MAQDKNLWRLPYGPNKQLKQRAGTNVRTLSLAASFDDELLPAKDRHTLRIKNLSGQTEEKISQANPAAGAEFTVTVPTGEVWEVEAVSFTLTAANAGAARRVELVIDDGTDRVREIIAQDTQPINVARRYWASKWGYQPTAVGIEIFLAFPEGPIKIPAGYRIRTVTTNIDPGDQYSAIFVNARRYIDLRIAIGQDVDATKKNYFTLPGNSEIYFGIHYGGLMLYDAKTLMQLFHCECDDEVNVVNVSASKACDIQLIEVY